MSQTAVVPPVDAAPTGRRGGLEGTRSRFKGSWGVKITIAVICFLWIVPVVGVVITSFRPLDDVLTSGWWDVIFHPHYLGHLTIQNYHHAISGAHLGDAFINSFAIALPATIIPILIAAFAAYAFAFMHFPGRDALFILIVSLLVVPNFVAFVPLLKIYSDVGIGGKFPAVWLAHIGFGMSLAIYILRNYMASLPLSLLESADIDGATHFQVFWLLILPMSTPALASFAIFQFLWVWNDLLVALVFIGPGENQPITIATQALLGQQGSGWELVTAGGILSMIVPVAVFLGLQRYFVRGLTAGSVKG